MIEILITENDGGQRLDRFLKKYLPGSPLSLVYKMIRKDVKVNGKRAAAEDVLEAGDVVKLYITDDEFGEFHKEKKVRRTRKTFAVAYEDGDVLICEKPYGLLTHGDAGEKKNTLANQVMGYLAEKGEYDPGAENTFAPAPQNRLDRNTTGLVIFAKNAPAARDLSRIIRERTSVKKIYRTIVSGRIEDEMILTGSLVKDEKKNRVKVSDQDGAKGAVTRVRPVKTDSSGKYTLVEVELVTGRTHQIRAHLAAAGHPVIGDQKYGDPKVNAYFKRKYGLTSQLLHAGKLVFADDEAAGSLAAKTVTAKTPKMFGAIERDIFK